MDGMLEEATVVTSISPGQIAHLSFLLNNNSQEPRGCSYEGSSEKHISAFSSDVCGPPQSVVHDNVVDVTVGYTSGSREPDLGSPLHSQATPTNIYTTHSRKNLSKIGHVLLAVEMALIAGMELGGCHECLRMAYKC